MNGFIEKLYSSFIKNRENACIKTDGTTYSYREILQLSENIRHQIKDIESKNIGIYLTDDVYMYASILAVWFEGRTYVPIHPDFPLSKNLSAIEQAEIKLILTSVDFEEDFGVTCVDSKQIFDLELSKPKDFLLSENAYILFTSGSTGNPKGVPITFSNLYYFTKSFETTFGKLTPEDKVLQMFELTFDLSVMSYLIPWMYGSTVVTLHKKETKYLQILDLLEANEITVALMVPSILNLIIPYLDPEIKNNSLRLNLFCGEALLTKQIENWKGFVPNANLYNVYGPTENTIFCTHYKIENPLKDRNGIICIGKSMTDSEMSFLNNEDSEGELLLSGKFLTKEYWKNPEKTKETFIIIEDKKLYKTGDWCFRDEDGDFYYLNRIDFQAKINGFRIELGEIEYFANQILNNAVSVAVVHKDQNDNDELVMFVNSETIDEQELLNHLRKNLADYAVPSRIIKIAKFPENTSGKTDRNALKKTLS